MSTSRGDVDAAVAGLQARWGAAAPRVVGALALAAAPEEAPAVRPEIAPAVDDRIIHTGFAALDAILGPGGLPRSASVAIRGDGSSGRTTLSLRVAAEAQAQGSVVAWLDLSRSFDPVEAVARGIRLEWLVVITPASLDEGLSIAGSLLAGRSVDMLVLDLPGGRLAKTDKPARIADRLHRLAALARRAETLFLILDAPGLAGGLATAVAESTGIRLELARRSWVRLGRDVVGQRTEALVAHNRHGPPGRRATLRILYAEGGERDACLAHDALLIDQAPVQTAIPAPITAPIHVNPHEAPDRKTHDHATSPPLRPASATSPGAGPTLRALPDRPARAGRPAVGSGAGHRRRPDRSSAGRPARHAVGERPPTRP
jgi:RecA/RadA recombinase